MSNQDPKKKVKGIVDIVFLMDATASMSSCIEAVKNNINSFIDSICDSTKQDNLVGDWRVKAVGYRDFLDDTKPLEDNPFVHNADALKAQLAALEPVGGGDEPQSLFDAIIHLAEMDTKIYNEEKAKIIEGKLRLRKDSRYARIPREEQQRARDHYANMMGRNK